MVERGVFGPVPQPLSSRGTYKVELERKNDTLEKNEEQCLNVELFRGGPS